MKCTIPGCRGEHEERHIVHTMRRDDDIVVMDHVPALVCPVCGDVLLTPATTNRIEELLKSNLKPIGTLPLYEYV